MASGRILIVHSSGSTAALMASLLSREGYAVETVENTYDAVARFVDEPAGVVLVGLSGLREGGMDFLKTLGKEQPRPRILVTFPAALRETAVKALQAGADGYVLEPFYPDEFVRLVAGHAGVEAAEQDAVSLPMLAREVAHAVNNPLQVVSLLLGDSKTPKRELVKHVTEEIGRVRDVVQHLEAYGTVGEAQTGPAVVAPLLTRAAAGRVKLELDTRGEPVALLDQRLFTEAMESLFDAIAGRAPETAIHGALREGGDFIEAQLDVPRSVFGEEEPARLVQSVFVVREDRSVVPGLALVHANLQAQRATMTIERRGRTIEFRLRLPKA